MVRHGRSRFFAFGLLPTLNTLSLLLYGLGVATSGSGGGIGMRESSMPVLLIVAAIHLLAAAVAMVKRGRDVGWPPWATVLIFLLALGPFLPLLLGYLALAKARPQADAKYGPPPPPADSRAWFWATLNLAWPWFVLMTIARV